MDWWHIAAIAQYALNGLFVFVAMMMPSTVRTQADVIQLNAQMQHPLFPTFALILSLLAPLATIWIIIWAWPKLRDYWQKDGKR